jgi:uncharacterized protein (DUF2249 family)
MLNPSTRLNKALELHPEILEYIISLHPHDFARLRNPIMRKLMSPRITLGRIAVMVGLPVQTILKRISELSGIEFQDSILELAQSPLEAPAWVLQSDSNTVRQINLLPMDERLDSDPMLPVNPAINRLKAGEILLIRHKWEPQPFYDIWQKIGNLEWYAQQVSPEEWWIWVQRKENT